MNERLRTVMMERGKKLTDIADACAVDPKTVERWITPGRIPHRRNRFTIAQALSVDENYLWPDLATSTDNAEDGPSEVVGTFSDRASVPREMWIRYLRQAKEKIDVLVFAGTFFAQTNPQVSRMLAERAAVGTRVRLCFGNPSGSAIQVRDKEEGLHGTLAAKIRASLTYYQPLIGTQGCEIRLHDTTLYTSIFRYDDHLITNPHVWGQPASANPAFVLRRKQDGGWFDRYVQSFDSVWDTATPWISGD